MPQQQVLCRASVILTMIMRLSGAATTTAKPKHLIITVIDDLGACRPSILAGHPARAVSSLLLRPPNDYFGPYLLAMSLTAVLPYRLRRFRVYERQPDQDSDLRLHACRWRRLHPVLRAAELFPYACDNPNWEETCSHWHQLLDPERRVRPSPQRDHLRTSDECAWLQISRRWQGVHRVPPATNAAPR